MKLQKSLSRKYKSRIYYKYIVVLPESEVKKTGFKEGEELKIISKKGEIKLNKSQ